MIVLGSFCSFLFCKKYRGEGMGTGRLILVYLCLKIVINTRRVLWGRFCFSHCSFSVNYCDCGSWDKVCGYLFMFPNNFGRKLYRFFCFINWNWWLYVLKFWFFGSSLIDMKIIENDARRSRFITCNCFCENLIYSCFLDTMSPNKEVRWHRFLPVYGLFFVWY